jgi:FkbM family methyltransferase
MFARRLNLLRSTPFSRVADDHPLLCLDVGSRHGFERDLEPIAFAVDGIGFEPDPVEFRRMQALHAREARDGSSPWRSLRHVPVALSGTGGRRTLHIPTFPDSASLLEHDASVGAAFQKMHMFRVERMVDVDTLTLDDAMARYGIAQPSYIKIDIEGAELEVFTASERTLSDVLAIKTEVAFIPFRRSQPVAADIDAFLRARGFVLMDLITPMRWRRGSSVAHPQLSSGSIPYSRGQLAQGDFLYFKRPDRIAADAEGTAARLRAALLAMCHGYFDHASVLLSAPEVTRYVRERYDIDTVAALRAASLVFGRVAWRGEFIEHLRRVVTFARSARHAAFG